MNILSFIFSNLKKRTSKYFHFLFCASCVAAVAFSPIEASAAVQDVSVTNWPASLTVTNVTWDQRLNQIQTALQDIRSYSNTIMNRFGWNGTYNFSQGFELLYDDVHSLASSTTISDSLIAFNREFPTGATSPNWSTKQFLANIRANFTEAFISGSNALNNPASNSYAGLIKSGNDTAISIDSKLTTTNSNLNLIRGSVDYLPIMSDDLWYIRSDVDSIESKTTAIKVNTDNMAVDTQNISEYTEVLPDMQSDLEKLRNFFADDATIALKNAAEPTSNSALQRFTGSGAGAASSTDYEGINAFGVGIKNTLNTGSSPSTALSYLGGGDQSPIQWFSQSTYDAFHPGTVSTMSVGDQDLSQYPYLQNYYNDIYNALGIQ